MSIQSWEKEFYSDPKEAAKTIRSACIHSIRKFIGLLTENVKKHNLILLSNWYLVNSYDEISVPRFRAGYIDSCAFCQRHINTSLFAEGLEHPAVLKCYECEVKKVFEFGCLQRGSVFAKAFDHYDPLEIVQAAIKILKHYHYKVPEEYKRWEK